jgi:hypothetical protein
MPITRKKRVNPTEQPESENHVVEQAENPVEAATPEQPAENLPGEGQVVAQSPATPVVAENSHPVYQPFPPVTPPATPVISSDRREGAERPERIARAERGERQEYAPTIEGGRRTSRGELFRRPPHPPVSQPAPPPVTQAPLQAPSREISLPLGNLLHLAYNPGYTGSDEARSELLQQLASESKAGGRARCWSCGSLAIVYDRWNTRSKTFGEVGVAFCEICGVWSVM